MGTRKSVDQILDTAADILEKHGWVTEECYNRDLGGFCALGAIAKAVYPKAKNEDIAELAYPSVDGEGSTDRRHVEAVKFLAKRVGKVADSESVYDFNDSLPAGLGYDGESRRVVLNEKVRLKSSRRVVTRLRSAANAYRKQQAKAV